MFDGYEAFEILTAHGADPEPFRLGTIQSVSGNGADILLDGFSGTGEPVRALDASGHVLKAGARVVLAVRRSRGKQTARYLILGVIGQSHEPYDSGWKQIDPDPGWTSNAHVRQIGNVLHFRGSLSGTLPANTTTFIGTSPLTASGSTQGVASTFTGGYRLDYLSISSTGRIAARNTTARTNTIFISPLSGLLTD